MERGGRRLWMLGVLALCLGLSGTGMSGDDRLDTRRMEVETPSRLLTSPDVTVSLDRWGPDPVASARDIEVTDLEGRDLSPEIHKRIIGDRLQFSRPEQRQFIIRPREVVIMSMPAERTALPGGVMTDAGEEAERDVWFRPTIMASPLPVTWNTHLRRYSTGILLGLQLPDGVSDMNLDQPITMRLGFRGLTAEPVEDVMLARPGLEHEQRVDLSFVPTTEAPVLELRSDLGNVDLLLDVLPRLELRPISDVMPGFGLGTVTFDVVRLHPHGIPAPVDEDTFISLEIVGGARSEPDRVVLRRGESRERFTLRSGNLGPVTVTATAAGLTDRRTIHQQFPVAPLIAALLGGALGGYSRRFQKKASDASDRAHVIEGTIVALLAYTASVLGVGFFRFPAAIAATTAGAFLTGALAGFIGVAVIEALSRRLGPSAG